jgi:hypothetical protein
MARRTFGARSKSRSSGAGNILILWLIGIVLALLIASDGSVAAKSTADASGLK